MFISFSFIALLFFLLFFCNILFTVILPVRDAIRQENSKKIK